MVSWFQTKVSAPLKASDTLLEATVPVKLTACSCPSSPLDYLAYKEAGGFEPGYLALYGLEPSVAWSRSFIGAQAGLPCTTTPSQ